MKELLILRHGKSDWSVDADDYHRPLTRRGKHSAQKMGIWMIQNGLVPDYVITSPATRARATAEKTCKALGLHHLSIRYDKRIYEASLTELYDVLADLPSSPKRVLLVGHNPGLEDLLRSLVTDIKTPADGKLLPTAALAHVQFNSNWSEVVHDGRLMSITYPKGLPDKFPFPADNGTEYRSRPAYYYIQSAVIPYRIRNGELEILLVSSSSNQHWIVPKGIKEPGMTPQDSAAKEAFEEAGVNGEVDNAALGQYTYTKWGSPCTVDVYPMRVTEILAETEWQESHRSRKWVSVKKAGKMLKHAELVKMVSLLKKSLGR